MADNGQVLDFRKVGNQVVGKLTKEKVPTDYVMVDGLGIGDVGTVILRDRQKMADDGVLIVIVPIEEQTSQVRGEIEVISRGFVFMKESTELLESIKDETANCLVPFQGHVTDWQALRHKIEKTLEKYTYSVTQRQPLILPVIIEV